MLNLSIVLYLLFFLSNTTLAMTELVFLKGSIKHGPQLGIPPLKKSELVEKARQAALDSHNPGEELQQVSAWKDAIDYFNPVYNGSDLCYEASISSTATFVPKSKINDQWSVPISAYSLANESHHGRCTKKDWNKAEVLAKEKADFFCGNETESAPITIEKKAEQFLDTWYQKCIYSGTYKCNNLEIKN